MGQTYYSLKIGEESLQVLPENLPTEKLSQIQQLAILKKKLVFKYKKWITNKQLLDFYPYQKPHGSN
jgi:ribosomal protein L30E